MSDIHLAVVHEVENGDKVDVLDSFQVEKRVFMPVPFQDGPEEWGAGGEDDLVRLDLIVVAG